MYIFFISLIKLSEKRKKKKYSDFVRKLLVFYPRGYFYFKSFQTMVKKIDGLLIRLGTSPQGTDEV